MTPEIATELIGALGFPIVISGVFVIIYVKSQETSRRDNKEREQRTNQLLDESQKRSEALLNQSQVLTQTNQLLVQTNAELAESNKDLVEANKLVVELLQGHLSRKN